ncbi:MAG: outer membrane lipoprotein carrier protein LolA [Cellvibrio sp.]|uniref:LolA family protein n=1 Tax=Cellvibrio sp. TaxID=1965322 RepID=UPI0031B3A926
MKSKMMMGVAFALSLFAGVVHSESSPKENADTLLAQLAQRSQQIQSLEGTFAQQKTIAVLPVPLSSNGRFSFEQGKEVVWETLMPVQSRLTLTPGGISFADAKGEQKTPAQAQQAGAEIVAKIFMGVIAGELDSLQDYFTLAATGTATDWQIRLVPRSANLSAYIASIELRGGEYTEHLDIAEANGDKTYIVFTTNKVVRKPAVQAKP